MDFVASITPPEAVVARAGSAETSVGNDSSLRHVVDIVGLTPIGAAPQGPVFSALLVLPHQGFVIICFR